MSDPDEFARRLKDSLRFSNLDEAEASVRAIDSLFRQCRQAGDPAGIRLCRARLSEGLRRARRLAGDARLSPAKRREKEEIARWFQLWLEGPDLFFDWLSARQDTAAYRDLLDETMPPR